MITAISGLAKVANATSAESLASSYGKWAGIRSNHVISADGNFAGIDGSSRSISTREDRELLVALRSRVDLIVVDAATARLEKYQTPSSGAALAIFSLSGRFDEIPAVEKPSGRVFLFSKTLSDRFSGRSDLAHVAIGDEPFNGFLDWAKDQNFESVLLEAGPTLTRYAFTASIVGQSAITRTPLSADKDPEASTNPFDSSALLVSFAVSEDASFSLWTH